MKLFTTAKTCITISLVVFTAGCQDHHFVPMSKADKKITLERPTEGHMVTPAKTFEAGKTAEKYLMTDEYQQPGGLIADGKITIGGNAKGKDFTGYTLYIIAKQVTEDGGVKAGPPIAVQKIVEPVFPANYRLDKSNVMMGQPPAAGVSILLEVRLDKDGGVMSKEAGDGYGSAKTKSGSAGADVVIDKLR